MNGTGVSPEECRFLEISGSKNLRQFKMSLNSIGEVQTFLMADPDINTNIFYEQKKLIKI